MVPLGEVANIISGATPKTGVAEYWDGDIPWVTPADLSNLRDSDIRATPRTITKAGLASCASTLLPAGSVLFSSRAPIGHVAINSVPMATNQGFKSLVTKPGVADAKYLYHWLKANTPYLQSLGNGATFKELSKATVARIEIPLPPLSEQRRIAAILDRADELRAKRRKVLAELDDLKQSIFRDMFAGGQYPNVLAGEVMTKMRNGLSPSTGGTVDAPVLTLSAVTNGRFDPRAVKWGTFSSEPPADKRVTAGDFLMCRGNGNRDLVGVGVCAGEDHNDLVFPDTVIAGRVDRMLVEMEYLAEAWRQPEVRSQIATAARTTNGTYKVNQQSLSKVQLPLPSIDEQRQYVSRAALIGAQRVRIQAAAAATDAELFASLQSRAFRGEL